MEVAVAWGSLWHVDITHERVQTAKDLLGRMLSSDLKRFGIQTAKAGGAKVSVEEIEAAMWRW
jgi:hypothetical protein